MKNNESRNSKLRLDKSLFSGSILGIASSTCASCSSMGFLVISTFGGFGIVATDFLTNYQIPLKILSIVILLWALYSVHSKITKACVFNTFTNNMQQKELQLQRSNNNIGSSAIKNIQNNTKK
jgi:hypothetical protein